VTTSSGADGARPAAAGRAPSPATQTATATDAGRPAEAAGPSDATAADTAAPRNSEPTRSEPAQARGPAEPGRQEPLLSLRGIGKNFGPVRALADIDLDIPAGQVTAIVGDNGAGKTTLIKTISGIWQADHGQMFWLGRQVHLHSPRDAAALGIATVYQDLALCDNLDIVQNMFLGHENLRHWQLDEISMELDAKRTLSDLAVMSVRSIRQPVGSLSGGQRQAVAVAKTVMQDAKLVIMDEPTAALGVSQTRIVLDLIGQLARRDIGVVVISHNLNDVMSVADRVAVLHLGRLAAVGPISRFDTQVIVDLMTTGRSSRGADGAATAWGADGGRPGEGTTAAAGNEATVTPAGGNAADGTPGDGSQGGTP
jgi:ABC-type sugar transport system ATPase subunit